MRNNLLDELIADYCGLDSAIADYPVVWVLQFMGLENEGRYRPGGRLENYCADLPLSSPSSAALGRLVRASIINLGQWNVETAQWRGQESYRVASIFTLAAFTLEELASPGAAKALAERFHSLLPALVAETTGVEIPRRLTNLRKEERG